jgi:hypothetical protein
VGAWINYLTIFFYKIIFLNQLQRSRPLLALIWLRHSIHSLHISIQQSFKSTIKFVGPTLGLINSMGDLKMRCVWYIFISFLVLLRSQFWLAIVEISVGAWINYLTNFLIKYFFKKKKTNCKGHGLAVLNVAPPLGVNLYATSLFSSYLVNVFFF